MGNLTTQCLKPHRFTEEILYLTAETIYMRLLLTSFCLALSAVVYCQKDSLVFLGGQIIVGEVKEMNKNVLTVKTDYSDSDFKIEWEKVSEFYSEQRYLVQLTDRSVLTNAQIEFLPSGRLKITDDYLSKEVALPEVVYIRQIDSGFWSKFSASIDLGFSLTKASNLRQYNASANLGYTSTQWTFRGTYRQVRSQQDDVVPVRRTEASLNADYALRNGIFFGAGLNFLSNTEQLLDLRTTGQVGSGYYIFRNNHMYWQTFLGVAINNENFIEIPELPSTDRESYEAVLGTEVNLYDVGDVNFFTSFTWYPSFTQAGRNRIDYRLDLSYDLPYDFYVKTGLTLNYDSKPTAGASETDYVLVTGFGWSF